MSKDKLSAEEVLEEEMSIATSEHIDKMPHLREWIVQAMDEYASIKCKEAESEAYSKGYKDGLLDA